MITIVEQRQELTTLVERGVLRNHAVDMLEQAYAKASERAAAETGLDPDAFPVNSPYTRDDQLFADRLES